MAPHACSSSISQEIRLFFPTDTDFSSQQILTLLPRYEGDATDLCLDFSIEDDTFGARTLHSLLSGGAHMAVTNTNKLHYIHLAADWHLNGRPGASSAAFAKGMAQVGDTCCAESQVVLLCVPLCGTREGKFILP